MSQEVYRIEELAETSGVSIRNIRYYTAEGLLPPPDARGRYALYTEEHVQRLRLIQQWKEAFFPLEIIRARLQELTALQVAELQSEHLGEDEERQGEKARQIDTGGRGSPAPTFAADDDTVGAGFPRPSAHAPAPASSQAPGSAADYIRRVLAKRSAVTPPAQSAAAPAPIMAASKAASASPMPEETVSAETWQRLPLAPGVELHVRHVDDRIRQLIAFARNLFRSDS